MKNILTAIILLTALFLCSCGAGGSAEAQDTSGVYTELRPETIDPGVVSVNSSEYSDPSTAGTEKNEHSTNVNLPDTEPIAGTSAAETHNETPDTIVTEESQSETVAPFEVETTRSVPETLVDIETGKDGEIELPIDIIE